MPAARRTAALLWIEVLAPAGADEGLVRTVVGERVEPRIVGELETHRPLAAAAVRGGVVAAFATCADAALCALSLRDFFRHESWKEAGLADPLRARIALHHGRVTVEESAPAGGAVERVAALARATPAGDVWATAACRPVAAAELDDRYALDEAAGAGAEGDVLRLRWSREREHAMVRAPGDDQLREVALTLSVPSSPRAEARPQRGDRAVRVFLSYSWDSDEYKHWVERLAVTLRRYGLDLRLDSWHRGGRTIPDFMSSEVRNADKVVILCTPGLQRKVHSTEDGERMTGVGWEAGLITGALFAGGAAKFIPVLARGEWLEAAPTWLQGYAYVDMRDPANVGAAVRELLREILGKTPQAPPLGQVPDDLGGGPVDPLV